MSIFESDSYYVFFFFIGISILIYVLLAIGNRFKRKQESHIDFEIYFLNDGFLSKNELAFYTTLKRILKDDLIIFSKVRLADIFSIGKGRGKQAALNRINSRHVDFLLCQKDSLKPILGIELDDKSHSRADRIKRDDFVNRLFERTGLPLLRYPAKYRYDEKDLIERLDPILAETTK